MKSLSLKWDWNIHSLIIFGLSNCELLVRWTTWYSTGWGLELVNSIEKIQFYQWHYTNHILPELMTGMPSNTKGHHFDWNIHSVESPSMVDPQWNIWYWGSKWNLHTVCWSAVGCEWGTTSVYFGITYVCFIPSRLPVFAVEPQYLLQYLFIFVKVSFELHIQNLQKISCWFKIWMEFVGPILIKLWMSSIWGFL